MAGSTRKYCRSIRQTRTPIIKGVMIENNGVDIKTAPVRMLTPFLENCDKRFLYAHYSKNCVIVKHGEFFTVYSNIEMFDVNQTRL